MCVLQKFIEELFERAEKDMNIVLVVERMKPIEYAFIGQEREVGRSVWNIDHDIDVKREYRPSFTGRYTWHHPRDYRLYMLLKKENASDVLEGQYYFLEGIEGQYWILQCKEECLAVVSPNEISDEDCRSIVNYLLM